MLCGKLYKITKIAWQMLAQSDIHKHGEILVLPHNYVYTVAMHLSLDVLIVREVGLGDTENVHCDYCNKWQCDYCGDIAVE